MCETLHPFPIWASTISHATWTLSWNSLLLPLCFTFLRGSGLHLPSSGCHSFLLQQHTGALPLQMPVDNTGRQLLGPFCAPQETSVYTWHSSTQKLLGMVWKCFQTVTPGWEKVGGASAFWHWTGRGHRVVYLSWGHQQVIEMWKGTVLHPQPLNY